MNQKPAGSDKDYLKEFSIDPVVKQKLMQYIDIIIDYKNRLNLVGEADKESIIQNLLITSIISTQLIDRKTVIDIGSGSGVVGIPIKLIINSVKLIICEKNLKKIAFINDVILKLNINNVDIIPENLQNIDKNSLQNVEQLLIRGIKLVNIYEILLDKFPRGTSIIYFGSEEDTTKAPVQILKTIPMPGNENRGKPLFIYSLKLV